MRLHKVALVACATLAILAAGTYSRPADAQEELNLRFADFLPATLPQMQVDQWFADELADLHPFIVALRERAEVSEAAAAFVETIEQQLKSRLETAGAYDPDAYRAAFAKIVEALR